ncbi:hypothetical protein B0A58_10050 [Flavobacterium branchiophilum NBRC 15030 = ATCC 35035]|uniref:DUF4252 domain-containing protein n=2 Tax=Flavobacterium branchiophilum TaxID=55197 RepID=G2Z3J7_FLABF|nr:DUF4252 domain-containing protein [Flavobacterium branchiophilum]OXA74830.1 hypothetical protein B0A58_10050 [Flavobacterium branchiophilum NBRC 15030 = ATCC 35035]TQM41377.1 uncharacterized protein DUF4252 [Flavobacterium branchiophilum]GEM54995.1 hypothetical protein FB1_12160 [Flavobacterium branchiophilum NBRC 15030 = ATCC 35035]CCB70446.1 Protein of unknown function precursor [Flavobacterium branchiophilum FL-15]
MKKVLVTIVFFVTNIIFAQNSFAKFENQESISSIIVNDKMFELMGQIKASDKETMQYLSFIKTLDNLKVFVTSNTKNATEMKVAAEKYLKTNTLEALASSSIHGKNAKVYVKSGSSEGKVKELFMFLESYGKDNQTIIFSLTGDFDLNDIATLTTKMNLPGADVLNQTSHK